MCVCVFLHIQTTFQKFRFTQPDPDTYAMPLYIFALSCSMVVSGIPFFLSSMGSLFSKLVGNKRIQGMGQSMLSAANSLANILGPVVSGIILPRVNVEFAMLLGAWVLIVLLLLLRWYEREKHFGLLFLKRVLFCFRNALYTDKFGQMKRVDAVSDKMVSPTEPLSDKETEEALLRKPRTLSNSFKNYVQQGLVPANNTSAASIQDFS